MNDNMESTESKLFCSTNKEDEYMKQKVKIRKRRFPCKNREKEKVQSKQIQ